MRDVASTLIGLFSDQPLSFTVRTKVYNPLTGTEVVTEVVKSVAASPPSSFEEKDYEGSPTLRRTDLKVIVAAKDCEDVGLELSGASEKTVYCTRAGIKYAVLVFRHVVSGDQEAATILALRK